MHSGSSQVKGRKILTPAKMLKSMLRKCFQSVGFDVVRHPPNERYPADFLAEDIDIIRKVQPWTMTSVERIYALIQAVRYLNANAIDGAVVECGVWKGGSMAAVARTLVQLNDCDRELYLFDTFEGMSAPTDEDVDFSGVRASDILRQDPAFYCDDAPLKSVKALLSQIGYPMNKIHFVKGKVEDTLPDHAPSVISLLRLDTDWYASTKHELTHLFPILASRGVIIIDDYGHWKGSQQACDEYFEENHIHILLNRIDYTGRIALKL
jgi:O-methyltransferase